MRCAVLAAADRPADGPDGAGPGPSLTERHTSHPSSAPDGFSVASKWGWGGEGARGRRRLGTGAQRGKPKAERVPGLAERPASSDRVTGAE